mgnify:CR=1 FL=1
MGAAVSYIFHADGRFFNARDVLMSAQLGSHQLGKMFRLFSQVHVLQWTRFVSRPFCSIGSWLDLIYLHVDVDESMPGTYLCPRNWFCHQHENMFTQRKSSNGIRTACDFGCSSSGSGT